MISILLKIKFINYTAKEKILAQRASVSFCFVRPHGGQCLISTGFSVAHSLSCLTQMSSLDFFPGWQVRQHQALILQVFFNSKVQLIV
jgi:hypothetical protein